MKKIISFILSFCILSTTLIKPLSVEAASSVVESAISWAVAIANDNSHGYSQSSRWGPDYDCSSFVISAFRSGGVDTGTATYTGNMRSQFTQHGFQWIPWNQIGSVSNLQRGDILLNEVSHTEIYLGNGQNVGAHSNRGYPQTGDQTGTEVSVSGYYNHPWDGVLRYVATDVCNCSTDYAGEYYVSTNSLPLTMRSGHGTGYSVVTSIPKGSTVFVSRADGSWAHVEWNNYSGYCSMEYLTKIEQEAKSYNLHVWVSDTGMGDVPSKFILGNRYYICYELIDETTGKRANETSNINYKATETIRNSSGKVFEYSYDNSDNNWINCVCEQEDTFTGTVTISGDVNVSCSVSFEVWADFTPAVGAWAWEGEESNEVKSISAGKTAYCSYLIRDNITKKNLNDVTTRCIRGEGYTVEVSISDPNGSVIKTKTYKNIDATWIDFVPSKIGSYKLKIKVSGTINGEKEITLSSVENEHSWGTWQVVTPATCTSYGVRTRKCSICGNIENQTITTTGHNMGQWTVTTPATCTSVGVRTRKCSICGTIENQTIAATGHDMGQWTITTPATCTLDGVKTRNCFNCGITESQKIKAVGHNYTSQVVSSTCTEKGYTIHTCENCGETYKDTFVSEVGHDYTGSITTYATCVSDGVLTYTCKECNEKKTSIIPAIGHDYETSVTSPTYEREGYTLHKCKKCGYSYKDTFVEAIATQHMNNVTEKNDAIENVTTKKVQTTKENTSPKKQIITVAKIKTFKAKNLKKKKVTFSLKAKTNGSVKLKYAVYSCSPSKNTKYIKVSKNGKVTIKKGAKKGKYRIIIIAKETSKYMYASKVVKITVK